MMNIFSQTLQLPENLPMGGYTGERLSIRKSEDIEVNGWSFVDSKTGRESMLCSIDALYAGDLIRAVRRDDCRLLLAASHTHYAPMLDSSKPQLGALATIAVDRYAEAINAAKKKEVSPNVCRIFRAEVPIPIYRRFDVPNTLLNRVLTKKAGMYPNAAQDIDRSLYIFDFSSGDRTLFTLVYHACHPVSRHDPSLLSPDYVGAVRKAIRERFGQVPALFLLGCAGDIRPNLAHKRIKWLPRNRFNWRFEKKPSHTSEVAVDDAYANAVARATVWQSLPLEQSPCLEIRTLRLKGQADVEIPCLLVAGRLRFEFVPYEVSHHFHLAAQKKDPMRFIVSCTNHTLGYLPHPKQIIAGGYEVDGSRNCMGLVKRVELKEDESF